MSAQAGFECCTDCKLEYQVIFKLGFLELAVARVEMLL